MPTWTPRQLKYIEWLATPPDLRPSRLSTTEDIARALGTSVRTLISWELLPNWWEAVYDCAKGQIGKALPEIIDALVTKAKGGSIPGIKLALQSLGVYSERVEQTVDLKGDQLVVVLNQGKDAPEKPVEE